MTPHKIDRYEIKSELGRGGMATVYRAYDPRFDRDVAIKVLPRQFLHDPQFRARFEREAKTIAALEHSAIAPVHDFGEENEQPYLVMRYMTGGSLADRLEDGPITVSEVTAILQRVGAALDRAHSRGIIHRDLKPGNILFDEDGDAFLSDFGIVKLAEATASFTGSAIIGTPAYMSPEQARGEDLDGRSDTYSLGAVLFEALTGKQPYEANTPMGQAMKHITDPVPRILEANPDLPPGCEAIIERAMAKEPTARYATAGELVRALAEVEQSPAALPQETIIEPPAPELEETVVEAGDMLPDLERIAAEKAEADSARVLSRPTTLPKWPEPSAPRPTTLPEWPGPGAPRPTTLPE